MILTCDWCGCEFQYDGEQTGNQGVYETIAGRAYKLLDKAALSERATRGAATRANRIQDVDHGAEYTRVRTLAEIIDDASALDYDPIKDADEHMAEHTEKTNGDESTVGA